MTLDDLRKLEKVATPGEWELNKLGVIRGGVERQYANGRAKSQLVSVMPVEDAPDERDANAALIAALRNAAPALIACAEALKMFVRAEEAFENDTGIQCDDALTDSYKAAREALRRLEQLT